MSKFVIGIFQIHQHHILFKTNSSVFAISITDGIMQPLSWPLFSSTTRNKNYNLNILFFSITFLYLLQHDDFLKSIQLQEIYLSVPLLLMQGYDTTLDIIALMLFQNRFPFHFELHLYL
jgi:hypothetical protein